MDAVFLKITEYDDQTTILAIMYLLTGVIPLIAQTFTEQKKSYPSVQTAINMWSADLPLSRSMHDENIYANALLWTVKNVCPQLREGITEVNVPAKNFSCDLILASQADSKPKEYLLLQSPVSSKGR